jgi:hypothetical protein
MSKPADRRAAKSGVANDSARDIGAEVLAARPPQVPWKILCKKYSMSRARLVQLRRTAISGKST